MGMNVAYELMNNNGKEVIGVGDSNFVEELERNKKIKLKVYKNSLKLKKELEENLIWKHKGKLMIIGFFTTIFFIGFLLMYLSYKAYQIESNMNYMINYSKPVEL